MNNEKLSLIKSGAFIPAHPLALTDDRKLDERRQRALTRYYLASGVNGLAVAVHSTQFAIREVGLFEDVLRCAAEEANKDTILVAGAVGPTKQAVSEAETAKKLGYDAVLLSCGGLPGLTEDELIARAKEVAKVMPIFGFYLQPAAGGRLLSSFYWKELAEITNLHAIKLAPFNRYQSLDVVRGVCESSRCNEVTLYTGNDDNIVVDLLTPFNTEANGKMVTKRILGGLLGHWAAWTSASVRIFKQIRAIADSGQAISPEILTLAAQVTESNAALFDASNGFAGCIPGIHEILRRQGLLANLITLDADEKLSPGQAEELTRIENAYPHLTDDDFVRQNLDKWLK